MVAKDFYMIDIDNDGLLIEFNDIRIDEDTDLFEYSKDGDFIITNDTKYLKPYGSNSDGILIAASFGKFVLDSKTFNDLELFDFFDFVEISDRYILFSTIQEFDVLKYDGDPCVKFNPFLPVKIVMEYVFSKDKLNLVNKDAFFVSNDIQRKLIVSDNVRTKLISSGLIGAKFTKVLAC